VLKHATNHIQQRYHTFEMKIGTTILITFILLVIVVFSMGGGHGTYLPAKVVYPFTMLIAILTKNGIGILPTIIAVGQIPIYALILTKKPKWKFIILGLHILAVIICLNLQSEMFE
jgi:uncharacterized BrkB/YihY/UPF0761 family membrane protein